ncbi:MAG TPA: NUDIX domain-containing protein, partial [Cryomorphaceae bacterium]|nr:NUDIX domain-containing protein [Cryomorphaceae bacterium]
AHFREIDAAGGLVHNENNEHLLIYRKGKWDLPKGKLDEGETPQQGALREVEEECGISDLKLGEELAPSYHIYELNGVRILKKTYWFEMTSAQQEFTPETEEDIEKVVWVDLNRNVVEELDTYPNIRLVLRRAIDLL